MNSGRRNRVAAFEVNELGGRMYGSTRPDGGGEVQLDAPATGATVAALPRIGDVFVVRKNPKPKCRSGCRSRWPTR